MDKVYFEKTDSLLKKLNSDGTKGLSRSQVEQNAKLYGENKFPAHKTASFFVLFLSQFQDLMIFILLFSAGVSFVLSYLESPSLTLSVLSEPIVILAIIFVNALVGALQESSAEKSLDALKEFEQPSATVLREDKLVKVPATELVCGDIIRLAAGNKAAADARLISFMSASFAVDESMLTGEAESVEKTTAVLNHKNFVGSVVNQDKVNMVFAGSLIVRGTATAVVTHVGAATQLGQIRQELSVAAATRTPLQQELDHFAKQLSVAVLVICLFVWLTNLHKFTSNEFGSYFRGAIYYFKISVALAVAAIPEGLPAVVTTCLALGAGRMAKRNALVRSLPSAETLGCTNCICSDKTGTLTANKMAVRYLIVFDEQPKLTAVGAVFEGEDYEYLHPRSAPIIIANNEVVSSDNELNLPRLLEAAEIGAACNAAVLERKQGKVLISSGEPTEAALLVLFEKLRQSDIPHSFNKILTLEFARDRKSMSVLVEDEGSYWLCTKGAPETLVKRCSSFKTAHKTIAMTEKRRFELLNQLETNFSSKGLRCLLLAKKELTKSEAIALIRKAKNEPDSAWFASAESGLTLHAVVALRDPPRPEAKRAVRLCKQAGIRVVMLTGDNLATGVAVAKEVGLLSEKAREICATGVDFFAKYEKNGEVSTEILDRLRVLARVEPAHKKKLVSYLRRAGLVVAMTGDGVNDAPALKRADIGVAMGSGTEVAREAAKMVLLDDNFASIVAAVEEGRLIYRNMQLFVRYLISSNIGEVLIIFLANLLGLPTVFAPIQLLWVNLVTDGLPATALSFNRGDASLMRQNPRNKRDKLVGVWSVLRFLLVGVYVAIATVYAFQKGLETSKIKGSTMALSVLVCIEMCNAFNALSEKQSLLTVGPFSNYWLILAVVTSLALHILLMHNDYLKNIFGLVELKRSDWVTIVLISLPVIILEEGWKYFIR